MFLCVEPTFADDPACKGTLPGPTCGYYSHETGYRPLEELIDGSLTWYSLWLYDFNDIGQIYGEGLTKAGDSGDMEWHSFLASPVPGDFTLDGPIDLNDYARFIQHFGLPTTGHSMYCNRADFDKDADTDISDFATFQNLFTGSGWHGSR